MRKKKAPIKGFAPDQIALSYFQVKRSEIDWDFYDHFPLNNEYFSQQRIFHPTIGSLETSQEEHFFSLHRTIAHGDDRLTKFIENSITIAVIDECKCDLGINLKIAQRIWQSGVVLEPNTHFEEVTFQSVFSIVLQFMIAWVPIELFPCGNQKIITDEFLHDYTHMACREEITSLTRYLHNEKTRCWCTSRDLMFSFTSGLSGCRHLATHRDFT
jgi:hypothetical protein